VEFDAIIGVIMDDVASKGDLTGSIDPIITVIRDFIAVKNDNGTTSISADSES